MTLAIATATRCRCGNAVELLELPTYALPNRWQAACEACLDPTEDAGPLAHVVGYGGTAQEALWDWQDSHDEAHQAKLALTPAGREVTCVVEVWRQAAAEFERQAGWYRRVYAHQRVTGGVGPTVVWQPNEFEAARGAENGRGA